MDRCYFICRRRRHCEYHYHDSYASTQVLLQTVIVFTTFLLAMVLFPSVQLRAQREIDTVLGRGRLPSLSDEAEGKLPYVEAVVKEAMRWNIVLPMGTAHACTEENEYRGYRIPKGAVVLMNIWYDFSCFAICMCRGH